MSPLTFSGSFNLSSPLSLSPIHPLRLGSRPSCVLSGAHVLPNPSCSRTPHATHYAVFPLQPSCSSFFIFPSLLFLTPLVSSQGIFYLFLESYLINYLHANVSGGFFCNSQLFTAQRQTNSVFRKAKGPSKEGSMHSMSCSWKNQTGSQT